MYFGILEYINNKYNISMGYSSKKKRVLKRWSFIHMHIITCVSMLLHDLVFNKHLLFIFN